MEMWNVEMLVITLALVSVMTGCGSARRALSIQQYCNSVYRIYCPCRCLSGMNFTSENMRVGHLFQKKKTGQFKGFKVQIKKLSEFLRNTFFHHLGHFYRYGITEGCSTFISRSHN